MLPNTALKKGVLVTVVDSNQLDTSKQLVERTSNVSNTKKW
jgi:hypothetical protein